MSSVAPYAKVSATFTETPAWKGSVNDGRVLQTAVVPPNHWTNYRSIPQSQSGDSLVYQWDGTVRVNSSKVWFDVDSNALRAPASWKIQYLDADGTWKDVTNPSAYTTTTGKANPNAVTFDAVAIVIHDHDLARADVTHQFGSDSVERAGLGSEHIGAVRHPAKGQRTESVRIERADHGMFGHDQIGEAAVHGVERFLEFVHERTLRGTTQQVHEHFGIGVGMEDRAFIFQLATQGRAIRQIAIVA